MTPIPRELAAFLRSLDDDLFLPALWMVRRTALGALLKFYQPDDRAIEAIEERMFATNRELYEFVIERMKEN